MVKQMLDDYRDNMLIAKMCEEEIPAVKRCYNRAPHIYGLQLSALETQYNTCLKIVDELDVKISTLLSNAHLPAKCQLIIIYYYLCGHKIEECADKLGVGTRQAFAIKATALSLLEKK